MELELFVKVTKGGKPMTLPVKPSYSIEMIKTQIQSLREIPVKEQVLTLNGVELKNEDNLTQFQIALFGFHTSQRRFPFIFLKIGEPRRKRSNLKLTGQKQFLTLR